MMAAPLSLHADAKCWLPLCKAPVGLLDSTLFLRRESPQKGMLEKWDTIFSPFINLWFP